MDTTQITIEGRRVEGYSVPMGSFNVVWLKTETGMLGCGAFDVEVLQKFDYPAARVFGVATMDDVLAAKVKDANTAAQQRGVKPGMSGREAIKLL